MEKPVDDIRCGTCERWNSRMENGIPKTYCRIDLKVRYENDMKGCLAWKERDE